MRSPRTWVTTLAVLGTAAMASMPTARADEAQAKKLLKAMSDYLASQKSISMDIDFEPRDCDARRAEVGADKLGLLDTQPAG